MAKRKLEVEENVELPIEVWIQILEPVLLDQKFLLYHSFNLSTVSKLLYRVVKERNKGIDWLLYLMKDAGSDQEKIKLVNLISKHGDRPLKMNKAIYYYFRSRELLLQALQAFMRKHGIFYVTERGSYQSGVGIKKLQKLKVEPKPVRDAYQAIIEDYLEMGRKRIALSQKMKRLYYSNNKK
jgi:hypothetical protein